MLKLIVLFVAQPLLADCGCMCVDGVAKTLCQTVSEARQNPNMCPPAHRCPVDPHGAIPPAKQQYFDAPAEHAHHCREVRVWDKSADAYTGVKICDVSTG
jgi:hypothetical protein